MQVRFEPELGPEVSVADPQAGVGSGS